MTSRRFAACLALLVLPGSSQAASLAPGEKIKAAVFDFELIDTSPQPETDAEKARLATLAPALRAGLAASGRYVPVDMSRVEAKARGQNLQNCGGCDATLAHEAGADVAVTGTVQKVSNLILNINIYIRDAKDDAPIKAMSVDIRGNTDESWKHGLDYLIRNRISGD